MIRGAIEIASPKVVAGWLYCNLRPLKGQSVLAFVGGRCVGSGKVSVFRRDLLEAGLGDGVCGFHFNVALEKSVDAGAIVVKLEASDLALLQSNAVIAQLEEAEVVNLRATPTEHPRLARA